MKQKHEFDNHIKNYRQNLNKTLALSGETSDFFAKLKAKKLLEWFPHLAQKPTTILDYGCGDGTMSSYVQQNFPIATVYGIDPSSESIAHAQRKFPHINFSTLRDDTISFVPGTFDLVYAAGVFHHIPFKKHEYYLAQIIKMLKPGGLFVLFELNPYNPLTRLTFRRCPIDKDATMLSPRYAKKLLKSSGLNPPVEGCKPKTIYYCFFPSFLKKLRPLEKFLKKFPLGALYASIIKKDFS